MKKLFYIFRHGQTDYNASKRIQSFLDIPLNDEGVSQAKILAEKLSDVPFGCIYSSPLSRALDTAKIVSGKRNIKIIIDSKLQERNLGVFAGKIVNTTNDPIDTPFDINADVVNIPLALISDANYVPKNGESYNMFAERVRDALEKIAQNTNEQIVGISTHGGVISALIKTFTDFARVGAPNTGYVKMQWDGNTFSLIELPDWLLKNNNKNQSR